MTEEEFLPMKRTMMHTLYQRIIYKKDTGIIKTKKYGGQLRTVIKEELNSSLLNIGTVVATTVVGVISGKSKTIGKSFLGVAGYKMIENMLYKSKLEDIVEKFTLDYLGKREDD